MAAFKHSLVVTDRFRQHLRNLKAQAALSAAHAWQQNLDPTQLDRSHQAWVATTAASLTEFQKAGSRLSAAYLAAFLSSELVHRVPVPSLPDSAGLARDGRPLTEALVPSLFTVKQAIGEGKEVPVALKLGLDRATRLVNEEAIAPARTALAEGIQQDDRVIGWRRVTGGGCGACLAAATGAIQQDDEVLEVHPFCSCTKEPVVADAPDRVTRPTGHQVFEGLTAQEQDRLLGPDKAELVRSGEIPLHALIQHDHMAVVDDGITEAPLEALHQS